MFWGAYTGGATSTTTRTPRPSAPSLEGLPPALVVLGGCDLLRDEGRAYATRLGQEGVDVKEVCYPGQPHGFVNFDFPAAAPAFEEIGAWLSRTLTTPSG